MKDAAFIGKHADNDISKIVPIVKDINKILEMDEVGTGAAIILPKNWRSTTTQF